MSNAPRLYDPAPAPLSAAEIRAEMDGQGEDATFPLEALGGPLGAIVEDTARVLQLPPELPGSIALGILSAAIGKGIVLRIPPRRTPGNLFVLATGTSGSGKSEAFRHIAAPIFALNAEEGKAHVQNVVPRMKARLAILHKKQKHLEGKEDGETELENTIREITETQLQLEPPALVLEDVTIQKLAAVMAANDETTAILSSDAGDVLSNILGRWNGTGRTDENIFLKGYSLDACDIRRMSRDVVHLDAPCISMTLVTTPDELRSLYANERLTAGGFLARCLTICVESRWSWDDGSIRDFAAETTDDWGNLIRACVQRYRFNPAQEFSATKEAVGIFRDMYNGLVAGFEKFHGIEPFVARWREQALRIAVVLHVARHRDAAGSNQLEADTAQNATALANWYGEQACDILEGSRRKAKTDRLQRLLDTLGRNDGEITLRDLKARHKWEAGEIHAMAEDHPAKLAIERRETGGRPSLVLIRLKE